MLEWCYVGTFYCQIKFINVSRLKKEKRLIYLSRLNWRHAGFITFAIGLVGASILLVNAELSFFDDRKNQKNQYFAETPSGLKAVEPQYGVTREEFEFISAFRGPILETDAKIGAPFTKKQLRAAIQNNFNKNNYLFQQYHLDEKDTLVAATVLKVHASVPVYKVTANYPRNLEDLLLDPSGNCSHFAIRLSLALEAIGLKAAIISNHTPNLLGHVFVDAYDPTTDRAFMLDANFGTMIKIQPTNGKSFIEFLLGKTAEERIKLSEELTITTFPVLFRYFDPVINAHSKMQLNVNTLNALRGDREDLWRRWLAKDLTHLPLWWVKAPNHKPQTLRQIAATIPDEFNISGDYADRILEASTQKH